MSSGEIYLCDNFTANSEIDMTYLSKNKNNQE